MDFDDKKGRQGFKTPDEEANLLKKIEVLQTEMKRCAGLLEELEQGAKEETGREE